MAASRPGSFAGEPVAGEPVADEPVADEAVADEAVADEAVADKAVADKAVADKAVAGDDELVQAMAEQQQEAQEAQENLTRLAARRQDEEFPAQRVRDEGGLYAHLLSAVDVVDANDRGRALYEQMRRTDDYESLFVNGLEGTRGQLLDLLEYLDSCVFRLGKPVNEASPEYNSFVNLRAYSKELRAKMDPRHKQMTEQDLKDHIELTHIMIFQMKLAGAHSFDNTEKNATPELKASKVERGQALAIKFAKSEKWKMAGAFALGALGALTVLVAVATVIALAANPATAIFALAVPIAKFGIEAAAVAGFYFACEFINFARNKYKQHKMAAAVVPEEKEPVHKDAFDPNVLDLAEEQPAPADERKAAPIRTTQKVCAFLRAHKPTMPTRTQVAKGAVVATGVGALAAPAAIAGIGAALDVAILPSSVALSSGIAGAATGDAVIGTAVGTAEVAGACMIPAATAIAGFGMMYRAFGFMKDAYHGKGDKMRRAVENMLPQAYNAADDGKPSVQVSEEGSINHPKGSRR